MITNIQLTNFKSFKNSTIKLAPLTLLSGLNNSGKSSIMQSIRMLWKYSKSGDPTLKGHGNLSEMKNVSASKLDPIKIDIGFEENINTYLQIDFRQDGEIQIESNDSYSITLPNLNYIGADRWGPRVNLPIFNAVGRLNDVGEFGEFVIDLLSRHELDIIAPELRHPSAEGETLEFNVRAWLEEISPNIEFRHSTDAKRDSSYATIDNFRPTNVGYGLSYTLPIIVSLLFNSISSETKANESHESYTNSIVLLENPEAHIHPKGQTAIGKLIALAISSGVQVIVETHSDHLMDGIRLAVKDGLISNENILFHYFSRTSHFESKIETPQLASDGKLSFWPDGFFDQTLKNRAKLARRI